MSIKPSNDWTLVVNKKQKNTASVDEPLTLSSFGLQADRTRPMAPKRLTEYDKITVKRGHNIKTYP